MKDVNTPEQPLDAAAVQARLTREIAAILAVKPDTIKPDAPLHSLGIDSMGFVEILVFIEKTFNLNLMESGLDRQHFSTIRALAACVSEKLPAP
ncbi:MAG: acyl carrier protein [Planctomycetota bacterium]